MKPKKLKVTKKDREHAARVCFTIGSARNNEGTDVQLADYRGEMSKKAFLLARMAFIMSDTLNQSEWWPEAEAMIRDGWSPNRTASE